MPDAVVDRITGVARELADRAFQDRVWVRGDDADHVGSYDESLAALFDDYAVEDVLADADAHGLTAAQAGALQALVDEIGRFHARVKPASSAAAVGAAGWTDIVRAAARYLDAVESVT